MTVHSNEISINTGEIGVIYLQELLLSRFWNTQRNFSTVYQNIQTLLSTPEFMMIMNERVKGVLVYEN